MKIFVVWKKNLERIVVKSTAKKISTRRLRTTIMNDATHIFSELFCVIPNFDCHRSLLRSSTDGFTEEFPVYVPIMPVRSSAVGFQF